MSDEPKSPGPFEPLPPKIAERVTYREGDQVPRTYDERQAHALEHIARRLDSIDDKLGKLIGVRKETLSPEDWKQIVGGPQT